MCHLSALLFSDSQLLYLTFDWLPSWWFMVPAAFIANQGAIRAIWWVKCLKKSGDIPEINYFLVQHPSVEMLTFPVMLQAIQREKPEKYRKLQDASRSAEALVEQMVNGNYMGVALDNLLRDLINEQVHIYHKNCISTYCLNGTVKWYCLIFFYYFWMLNLLIRKEEKKYCCLVPCKEMC